MRQTSVLCKSLIVSDINYKSQDKILSLQTLLYGVSVLKVSSKGKANERRIYLNEQHTTILMWVSHKKTSKNSFVKLTHLLKIERKPSSKSFSNCKKSPDLSKVATLTFKKKVLSLIFCSESELVLFLSGIHFMIDEKILFQNNRVNTQEDVQHEIWNKADKDRNAVLSLEEIKKMMVDMNLQANHTQIIQLFQRFDGNQNQLIEKHEFDEMIEELMQRPEIDEVFYKYSGGDDQMLRKEFHKFIKDYQNKDNYKEIFDIFSEELEGSQRMTRAKFRNFLLSPDFNSVTRPENSEPWMDMNQPLPQYFIASSHNTYLEGNQLTGVSSSNQYAKVLLDGCRCVEIDTWDGDEEPKVTHGHTLVSNVSLRDVIVEIKNSAFVVSSYPVILSFENHCSKRQISKIGEILTDILGNSIFVPVGTTWPSPESLKYKFIIKAKLKSKHESGPFGRLIGLKGCKFSPTQSITEISSIKESHIKKLVSKHGCGEMIKLLSERFIRVYPKASRIDSSNYNCVDQWIYGANIVAINYQSRDLWWLIYTNWFLGNGRCGYVLKPDFMRDSSILFDFHGESFEHPSLELNVKVMSAFNLPKKDNSSDIVSPFVEVTLMGIPKDQAVHRTSQVSRNGFNPIWKERFSFPIRLYELGVLVFKVFTEDDELLCINSVPLYYLNPGIRSIALLDSKFRPVNNCALLCQFTISPLE
jgi:phosphatidylinositol phospholipase C delta